MMKIIYQSNPLTTIVELDDNDREILRLKLIIENLEDRIYGAHFDLEPGDRFDAEAARRELDVESLEDEPLNERINKMLGYCLDELHGTHCGDCTCVPCSCLKCHAEYLLGIDTIKGLGKHPAHYVNSAFSEGRTTLDEAIAWLSAYKPVKNKSWEGISQEEFDRHIPRWTEEARLACEWLKNYQQKHFSGE